MNKILNSHQYEILNQKNKKIKYIPMNIMLPTRTYGPYYRQKGVYFKFHKMIIVDDK